MGSGTRTAVANKNVSEPRMAATYPCRIDRSVSTVVILVHCHAQRFVDRVGGRGVRWAHARHALARGLVHLQRMFRQASHGLFGSVRIGWAPQPHRDIEIVSPKTKMQW